MAAERMRAKLMQNTSMYPTNMPSPTDCRFGDLGIPVGTIFENRQKLVEVGLHTKSFAGISGSTALGAFSIVVSGGYADDDDQGDLLVYTGTGGQNDSFSGHSEQTEDQTFAHNDNRALLKSAETKRPVRVIRGSESRSKYAPEIGYRFDGMYVVEEAYLDKGVHGYAVCRYRLRRVAGQNPIPMADYVPAPKSRRRRSALAF